MSNEGGLQDSELTQEFLPLLDRGDELVRRSPGSKVVSQFVEGVAEPLGRSKTFEAQHRIVALFHAPVVLLDYFGSGSTNASLACPALPQSRVDTSCAHQWSPVPDSVQQLLSRSGRSAGPPPCPAWH